MISWTATDGKGLVDIAQKPTLNETWEGQELMCFFDGSAGTATISVEALQHVDADPALHSGSGVSHQAQQCSTLGGFHLWAALQEGQWWEAAIK